MKWKFWLALVLFGIESLAQAVPLATIGTFCGTFPNICRQGTESLLSARGEGTNDYYVLEADPTTGGLLVNVVAGTITATNPSLGPTGAAVPADGTYVGLNNGGNLIGAIGDSSGRQIVAGAGTAGAAAGGVLTVQGSASGTAIPISGSVTASQGSPPWTVTGTGTAGTAASGVLTIQGIASMTAVKVDGSGVTGPVNVTQFGSSAVVTGTGASGAGIPRVTVSNDSTVGLVAGSAIVGKVGIDQTTPGTTNAVSETNFPTTVDVNAGLIGASTVRTSRGGFPSTTTVVTSNDYSGNNVTTSAYLQVIASTANATNTLCVSNSNAAPLKIATGASLSEVDRIYLPGGGSGCYDINIPASTRISLKSISGTASTGFFLYTAY